MLEFTDFGRRQGASNDVRAMRSQYTDETSVGPTLHYAHESLFIDVGVINSAVLTNQFTQLLDRRICPTIDLTFVSGLYREARGECLHR